MVSEVDKVALQRAIERCNADAIGVLLADDVLAILPDILRVKAHGWGQVLAKFADGGWVLSEGTLSTRRGK